MVLRSVLTRSAWDMAVLLCGLMIISWRGGGSDVKGSSLGQSVTTAARSHSPPAFGHWPNKGVAFPCRMRQNKARESFWHMGVHARRSCHLRDECDESDSKQ